MLENGLHALSLATDVYSFGCLMFELLCGTTPWAWIPDSNIARYRLRYPDRDLITDAIRRGDVGFQVADCGTLKEPQGVAVALLQLMMECWDHDPSKRPKIGGISIRLYDIADAAGVE